MGFIAPANCREKSPTLRARKQQTQSLDSAPDVTNAKVFGRDGSRHLNQQGAGDGARNGVRGLYGQHLGSQRLYYGFPGAQPVSPAFGRGSADRGVYSHFQAKGSQRWGTGN